nr:bORF2 [Murid betaherpesvirus 8]WPH25069.1 bORF2 [Murid betaherpesvirus 8]
MLIEETVQCLLTYPGANFFTMGRVLSNPAKHTYHD